MWIVPGWYSEKWWENAGDISCTKDQVKKAAGNYLATRPLPLDGSSVLTIAGKVTKRIAYMFCHFKNSEIIVICMVSFGFKGFVVDAIKHTMLTLSIFGSQISLKFTTFCLLRSSSCVMVLM